MILDRLCYPLAFITTRRSCAHITSPTPTLGFLRVREADGSRHAGHILSPEQVRELPHRSASGSSPELQKQLSTPAGAPGEVGGVHTPREPSLGGGQELGDKCHPPSPGGTILIHSSSEGVLQDGALLHKGHSQPAPNTPYVGFASFPISPPPPSCSLHLLPSQAQHPGPGLRLCFGGTQTEAGLHPPSIPEDTRNRNGYTKTTSGGFYEEGDVSYSPQFYSSA